MALAPADLPNDIVALQQIILELHTKIDLLQQQIQYLRHQRFGASSERISAQGELFGQVEELPLPPEEKQKISYERNRHGRPSLPKDLPRQRIDYDLTLEEKSGYDQLRRIGEETSETLEYTPAKLIVIEHTRAQYVAQKGEESTILTAHAQPSPLPKSNAGAGLLSHLLISTFADHLPLNRQEKIFKRHGVDLPRSTLCEWKLQSAELLQTLIAPLKAHVLAAPRLHSDDTRMPLLEKNRGHTKTARLWGYLGAGSRQNDEEKWIEHAPAVVFEFTESREAMHPIRFLQNYEGYLQADAYAGYDALYQTGKIIEVGCWAHARRKFFEVAQGQKHPGLAHEAVIWIKRLYEIEATIKTEPPDKKCEARQNQSVPILNDFKTWCEAQQQKLLPQGPLGRAFGYTLNNWQALTRYTENGVLLIDNNSLESTLRPIAIGRKNYLFAGSIRGGKSAAVMYSLIGTAKLNAIEPYAYLKDVLTRLPSYPANRVADLLPFNWRKPDTN